MIASRFTSAIRRWPSASRYPLLSEMFWMLKTSSCMPIGWNDCAASSLTRRMNSSRLPLSSSTVNWETMLRIVPDTISVSCGFNASRGVSR